jgi:hypothetical protein
MAKVNSIEAEIPDDLERMADKLLHSARQLPPGPDRHDILKELDKFRARIAAFKAKGK